MKNGDPMSSEAKEKMIQSKRERHLEELSKINVPEASDRELAVPSHRKNHRFSSVDEYRSVLERTGWSVKEFAQNGYSKNQVVFFNYLLKGKLAITREQLIVEYQENHLELVEIAEKYGIPKDYMPMVREHFGIKRIGAKGLKRARGTKPLSDRQRQIVYGSLLGDASIDKGGCLRIKHGGPQSVYTECLAEEFKEHCKDNNPIDYNRYFDERRGRFVESHTLRTQTHRTFKDLRRLFYPKGKKVVTPEILGSISALGMAVWFMDDGTTLFHFNNEGDALGAEIRLYTCGFTTEECELIRTWMKEKWGSETTLRYKKPKESQNPFIAISTTDTFRFLDLIRPHVYDCMLYKILPKEWLKWRASKGKLDVFGYHGKVGTIDSQGNFTPISE